ncbi:D-Ala-D-Ala carboxypeptidase family metallohydrolase [Saprospiraceae bacterium]|nr:D-Ala-D-Ala carboxypeptidase family metallohydrolase [Saprospiraceae bacterium]
MRANVVNQEKILSKAGIDDFFAGLKTIQFEELEKDFLQYSFSDVEKYKSIVGNLEYTIVPRSSLSKNIVGEIMLKDFICEDKFTQACFLNRRKQVVCVFDRRIFYRTLELQNELTALGYDEKGFKVVSGHRHPMYNEKIGGATGSRHLRGEAVDIRILDINNDGSINQADKMIVLDILERKIIGDRGGIGLYPGTMSLHYDVRGKKARWNSY